MMINSILSLVLACCLLVLGGYLAVRPGAGQQGYGPDLDTVDDDGLFDGWDGFTPGERRKRLAVYQRRVRARIAEQESEWLRARLRECAKG
ncbi:hypothetical protein E0E52_10520 [Azotobacter chroococcum]|uniref:hypothetical protein n=1 Tax=Azotobacter chroococcum TaxID=353 RepID=UPI00103E84B6|nr:hypothetical protein [Azotobacter chroococcum]TBW07882.1 hypothetical protein E0E52_10520 [Azotobacter chroococcum]